MNICFVIYSLAGGGAERVMATLANAWATKGWKVTLLTFAGPAVKPAYTLDSRVRLHQLGLLGPGQSKLNSLWRNLHNLWTLRKAVAACRPDCVISFMDVVNLFTLVATFGLRYRVLVSERVDPSCHPIHPLWRKVRPLLYRLAAAVVAQTARAAVALGPTLAARTVIIPNPVCLPQVLPSRSPETRIVALGRLVPQKGFDLLLQAFARLGPQWDAWTLRIYGEGPQRVELEALIGNLGLHQRVELVGWTDAPGEVLRQADVFVLSSRYEGFPNVLVEAMACGVPVIAFDCPSGPAEIIHTGEDGILVPAGDVATLADALENLMSDQRERQRLSENARRAVARFALPTILEQWETLVTNALRGRA